MWNIIYEEQNLRWYKFLYSIISSPYSYCVTVKFHRFPVYEQSARTHIYKKCVVGRTIFV